MILKTVLLIIASEGYQPIEYGLTRKVLEEAGINVLVASNIAGTAHAKPSSGHAKNCDDPECSKVAEEYARYTKAPIDKTFADINPDAYDGIFIIGGPGAMEFLDNQATYKIMQQIAQKGKPFGAICISPRILAHAGLLNGKKATGWNGDKKLDALFKQYKVIYKKQPVITDGVIVTADGPQAALEFGKAIVAVMQKS